MCWHSLQFIFKVAENTRLDYKEVKLLSTDTAGLRVGWILSDHDSAASTCSCCFVRIQQAVLCAGISYVFIKTFNDF